jgi:hypothetical protein
MTDAVKWQIEHFAKPYDVFDIKEVARKQKELGRTLTMDEYEVYVVGQRFLGREKGFVAKTTH